MDMILINNICIPIVIQVRNIAYFIWLKKICILYFVGIETLHTLNAEDICFCPTNEGNESLFNGLRTGKKQQQRTKQI